MTPGPIHLLQLCLHLPAPGSFQARGSPSNYPAMTSAFWQALECGYWLGDRGRIFCDDEEQGQPQHGTEQGHVRAHVGCSWSDRQYLPITALGDFGKYLFCLLVQGGLLIREVSTMIFIARFSFVLTFDL